MINVKYFNFMREFFSDSLENYRICYFSSSQGHEEDVGRIGLTIICTGLLSSVICGVILDKTHKFK